MGPDPDAEAVAERILDAARGTIDILAIHLGDRLGWYRSLAREGPASSSELAQRTGTSERYVREWLEQQAITGLLAVTGDDSRRFTLPQGSAEVLTDTGSLNYLAPLARMLAGAAIQLPALQRSYRTGTGVSWSEFGADARESQAEMNRPWFELKLADALGGAPSLMSRLQPEGTRIADIGCGAGWSTIALARMFPMARVHGFDIDTESITLARTNATITGSAVSFEHADATELPSARFDAIFAFECVHDLPYPVEVLAAARRALRQDGTLVVMDEAVAASFAPPGDDLERLMYGFSLLICLPDGMAHPDSAGTGTVMRPDTLRRYALDAGFADVRILPIEDFGFFRFYELVP
ncbi:class I SAM-dependent methyltransferase [Arthrobacter burdickii]|uniref:Class I SAM-dependent methyltransferase n=1 Tax=Arthrobacter burdickii TaxID=3035920 RepID=A0ABT8JXS7_9MICC|nr:class I SAM-dependent methyltransferase [Arthrobacter burdickii]MDN4609986.1 class I SAM-dependent methyltransferase [Arthrobacter burdickii]